MSRLATNVPLEVKVWIVYPPDWVIAPPSAAASTSPSTPYLMPYREAEEYCTKFAGEVSAIELIAEVLLHSPAIKV
jgi:hypothetical protein